MISSAPDKRFRLDGRTALITGIGPGIGSHVAKAYAAAGANVVLCARSRDKLEVLAKAINDSGGRAIAVPADVGKKEDLERLLAEASAAFGAVDILFHNAAGVAVQRRAATLDSTDEDWELCFQVNLLAPFRLAKALVPGMRARGRSVIINVLTTAAFRPQQPFGPYGATKAGLAFLTRQLAKECAPEVRVNAICPGTISSDGVVREQWRGHMAHGSIPLGRIGMADEVVGAALYLASDASSYVTGQTIFVDGGRVNTVA